MQLWMVEKIQYSTQLITETMNKLKLSAQTRTLKLAQSLVHILYFYKLVLDTGK